MAAKITAKASELREFAKCVASGQNLSDIARQLNRPRTGIMKKARHPTSMTQVSTSYHPSQLTDKQKHLRFNTNHAVSVELTPIDG